MTLATGVVVVAALSLAREVLLPITLAVLLSLVLAPLVEVLRRIRLGRVPSVLAAALLSLVVTHLPDNNDAAIVIVNHVRSPATMLHEILPS